MQPATGSTKSGNMLGVNHPVTSMEHMYFLTETLPELEALDFRVPIIRDPGR